MDKSPDSDSRVGVDMPIPRFAHQVVYNPNTKAIYLHGGNAGWEHWVSDTDAGEGHASTGGDESAGHVKVLKEKRLDDFWRMELKRFVF